MQDDEIDAMIQTLKDAGVPDAQVICLLEILGRAEELSAELATGLKLFEKQRVQETVAGAVLKIITGT